MTALSDRIPQIKAIVAADIQDMDEKQFEQLFKQFYNPLYVYAYTIVNDEAAAEEVVQTIFLKLWEKRQALDIHTSWKAYLYKAVFHECLNNKKRERLHQRFLDRQMNNAGFQEAESDSELRNRLQVALRKLPEKCRTVFQLSRFEELRYQEIADRLGISVKTVEAHMGKALKILRVQLADFLACLAFLLINLFEL